MSLKILTCQVWAQKKPLGNTEGFSKEKNPPRQRTVRRSKSPENEKISNIPWQKCFSITFVMFFTKTVKILVPHKVPIWVWKSQHAKFWSKNPLKNAEGFIKEKLAGYQASKKVVKITGKWKNLKYSMTEMFLNYFCNVLHKNNKNSCVS